MITHDQPKPINCLRYALSRVFEVPYLEVPDHFEVPTDALSRQEELVNYAREFEKEPIGLLVLEHPSWDHLYWCGALFGALRTSIPEVTDSCIIGGRTNEGTLHCVTVSELSSPSSFLIEESSMTPYFLSTNTPNSFLCPFVDESGLSYYTVFAFKETTRRQTNAPA